MRGPIINLLGLSLAFLQLLCLSPSQSVSVSSPKETETLKFSYSTFNKLLSTQPIQTLGDYFLLLSASLSLSLSLSVLLSPNTHHICVDSQLARNVWTVLTVLGRQSGFPKIRLIDCIFFSHWLTDWQWQCCGCGWLRVSVYACVYVLQSQHSTRWMCTCRTKKRLRKEAGEADYTVHVQLNVCLHECAQICAYPSCAFKWE